MTYEKLKDWLQVICGIDEKYKHNENYTETQYVSMLIIKYYCDSYIRIDYIYYLKSNGCINYESIKLPKEIKSFNIELKDITDY